MADGDDDGRGDEKTGPTVRSILVGVGVTVVGVIVLVLVGTWLYLNVFRDAAPEELSLEAVTTTTTAAPGAPMAGTATGDGDVGTTVAPAEAGDGDGPGGTWVATTESVVGYRVDEILFGQNATAVGRTSTVAGSMTIDGSTVVDAAFEADLTTVESDDGRRDNQFRGRIMDVAQFPTAAFALTEPIELGAVPEVGEIVEAEATGELTLRGTARPVTFAVRARWSGPTAEVDGSIPVVFDEWGIPNPSFGPISTEDNGVLEFVLVFARP